MKKLLSAIICISLLFSANLYAEECSPDIIWEGEITNPTDKILHIKIYNNEKVNGTDMVGMDSPYIDIIMQPRETRKIEYECGKNSIHFIDKETNTYKSMDFEVPGTFIEGKNPQFLFQKRSEKLSL